MLGGSDDLLCEQVDYIQREPAFVGGAWNHWNHPDVFKRFGRCLNSENIFAIKPMLYPLGLFQNCSPLMKLWLRPSHDFYHGYRSDWTNEDVKMKFRRLQSCKDYFLLRFYCEACISCDVRLLLAMFFSNLKWNNFSVRGNELICWSGNKSCSTWWLLSVWVLIKNVFVVSLQHFCETEVIFLSLY